MTDLGNHHLPSPSQPLPPMGRSSHFSMLWSSAPTTSPPSIITKTYRTTPIQSFGQWVTRYYGQNCSRNDVQSKWDNYQDTIITGYYHFFPTKTLKYPPNDKPWVTPRIKRLIQQRNKAFYTNECMYKFFRNQVITEIKTARIFYPRKVHRLSHMSQWYTKHKDLCGLNRPSSAFPFVTNMSNQNATTLPPYAKLCPGLTSPTPGLLPLPLTSFQCSYF